MTGKLIIRRRQNHCAVDFVPSVPDKESEPQYRFKRSAFDVADLLEGLELRDAQRFQKSEDGEFGMMERVRKAIETAERAAASERPSGEAIHFRRDLWHEVLFYTSGELVGQRIAGYVPYAEKNGLWARAWPGPDRSLISRTWTPHMEGTVGLQQSLANLVTELAAPPIQ